MADAKITLEQVLHVAKLARLTLSHEEAVQMQVQLDAILGYMEGLDELDVSDVPPTFHSIPMDAPLRPDVPERCSDRSERTRIFWGFWSFSVAVCEEVISFSFRESFAGPLEHTPRADMNEFVGVFVWDPSLSAIRSHSFYALSRQ